MRKNSAYGMALAAAALLTWGAPPAQPQTRDLLTNNPYSMDSGDARLPPNGCRKKDSAYFGQESAYAVRKSRYFRQESPYVRNSGQNRFEKLLQSARSLLS